MLVVVCIGMAVLRLLLSLSAVSGIVAVRIARCAFIHMQVCLEMRLWMLSRIYSKQA